MDFIMELKRASKAAAEFLSIILEINNEDHILKYKYNGEGMNIDKRRQVNNRNMGLPLKNRIEIANIGGKEV